MKIKKLWVSKYKNVENIDLTFNTELITLLVGKNGLGKSNLIEILVLIFEVLSESKNEKELLKWAGNNFEFEIFYEVELNDLKISVRNQKGENPNAEKIIFTCESRPTLSEIDFPFTDIDFKNFIQNRANNLPKHILGYYSGENKRIANIISKSEAKVKADQKANKFSEEFRYLFFTQNYHCEFLLLTLLIYNKSPFKEKFKKLTEHYLNIEEFLGIEITFKSPNWDYSSTAKEEYKNTGVNYLFENYENGMEFPFWGCKGKPNILMQFLYDSSSSLPAINDNESANIKPGSANYFEEIIFNNLNIKELTKDIEKYFPKPINLFDAIESCFEIDILKEINFKIRKSGVKDLIVFSELSEGERQLITVMSLLLIIGQSHSLFLFDEPDTHLNPDWQRDFAKLLDEFTLEDEKTKEDNSHIIVATHSPLIVQAADEADVFLFYRNEENKIITESDIDIHNYRIDQVLSSKYFGFQNTRPPSLDEFMNLRLKLLNKSKLSKADLDQLEQFKNEFGNLPTGETMLELENQLLINKVAKKLSKHDTNN